jgi:hypothetical protein
MACCSWIGGVGLGGLGGGDGGMFRALMVAGTVVAGEAATGCGLRAGSAMAFSRSFDRRRTRGVTIERFDSSHPRPRVIDSRPFRFSPTP